MAEKTKSEDKTVSKTSIGRGVMIVLTILALGFIILFIKSWWPDPDSDSDDRPNGSSEVRAQAQPYVPSGTRENPIRIEVGPDLKTEWVNGRGGMAFCFAPTRSTGLVQVEAQDLLFNTWVLGERPELEDSIQRFRFENLSDRNLMVLVWFVPTHESC